MTWTKRRAELAELRARSEAHYSRCKVTSRSIVNHLIDWAISSLWCTRSYGLLTWSSWRANGSEFPRTMTSGSSI